MQSQSQDFLIQKIIGSSPPETFHPVDVPFHRSAEHGIEINHIKAFRGSPLKEGAKNLMKQMDAPEGLRYSFISAIKGRKPDPADFIEDGAFLQTGYLSLLSQEPAHDGRITTLAKGGIQYGERSFWRKEPA